MLLSFGFTYLFFYNGRQNINLVLPLMKQEFQSDLGTLGVVSSALFWCYAFGFVQEKFGWSAIFVTIGCLYIILLVLTLIARKMKMKRL